jgi:hypothetical protein
VVVAVVVAVADGDHSGHGHDHFYGHDHDHVYDHGSARSYFTDLERSMAWFLVQTLVEAATLTKYPRPAMYRPVLPATWVCALGDFALSVTQTLPTFLKLMKGSVGFSSTSLAIGE